MGVWEKLEDKTQSFGPIFGESVDRTLLTAYEPLGDLCILV